MDSALPCPWLLSYKQGGFERVNDARHPPELPSWGPAQSPPSGLVLEFVKVALSLATT